MVTRDEKDLSNQTARKINKHLPKHSWINNNPYYPSSSFNNVF